MAKRRRKGLLAKKKAKNSGGARRRKAARPRPRRNSSGDHVIGDSALELSYEGGEGKRKGDMRGPWKHEFESGDVQVIGKLDGAIELRSKSGARLWDVFEV